MVPPYLHLGFPWFLLPCHQPQKYIIPKFYFINKFSIQPIISITVCFCNCLIKIYCCWFISLLDLYIILYYMYVKLKTILHKTFLTPNQHFMVPSTMTPDALFVIRLSLSLSLCLSLYIYIKIGRSKREICIFWIYSFCSYIRVIYVYVYSLLLSSENMWHKALLMVLFPVWMIFSWFGAGFI